MIVYNTNFPHNMPTLIQVLVCVFLASLSSCVHKTAEIALNSSTPKTNPTPPNPSTNDRIGVKIDPRSTMIVDPPAGNIWEMYVLKDAGELLTSETANGKVTIESLGSRKRKYTWMNEDGSESNRVVTLRPRHSVWYGLTGIYDPAGYRPGQATARAVVQEGRLYALTEKDAVVWLNVTPGYGWAISSDGIAVGFNRVPERSQVNIDVVQIFVAGRSLKTLANGRSVVLREMIVNPATSRSTEGEEPGSGREKEAH